MSRTAFSPRIIALAILTLLIASCGGAAPNESVAQPTMPVAATEAPIISETAVPTSPPVIAPTALPAIPERRRLTLEYPPRIRAGDADVVRLTLQVDESGNLTSTAEVDGNIVTGDVIEIPNLYETHQVIVEARFDVAGLQVSPPDVASQILAPGQTVRFFWSVRPLEVGVYKGTVWLFLRFVDKVSEEESQIAVSAQSVEIEAVNLFGIRANVARVVGGLGSVVGAVVGFPFFADIVRFLWGRRKKRK